MNKAALPAIGSKVLVCGSFGADDPQTVTVIGHGEKNGRPVFDYEQADGETKWAYLDQIEA